MIRAEQIPDEVVEAAARALAKQRLDADVWDEVLDRNMRYFYLQDARAAIAAGLQAWPKMVQYPLHEIDCTPPKIVLPLPQEGRDE